MTSNEKLEKLLGRTAPRVLYALAKTDSYRAKGTTLTEMDVNRNNDVRTVVNELRRLLPLLEAGQAMRDWCEHLRVLLIKAGYKREAEGIIEQYNAALAAALGEK